jgi:hypothetical protein
METRHLMPPSTGGSPIERVLGRLVGVRKNGTGYRAHCPVDGHGKGRGDKNPSLSVGEGEDGRVILYCHAGCSTEAVIAALGLRTGDLFNRPNEHRSGQTKETIYAVRDPEGKVAGYHHRRDLGNGNKKMWWTTPDGKKGLGGRKSASLPLYGSDDLRDTPEAGVVVVVEGEKARGAVEALGLVSAVATVCGANVTPAPEVLEVLRGRTAVLWPDHDQPGRRHMERIAERLRGIADEVRIMQWKDAPEGGDAADFVSAKTDEFEAAREMLRAMAAAPIWKSNDLHHRHDPHREDDDDEDGRRLVVKSFRALPKFRGPRPYVVKGLVPARFPTTIYGDGGSAKSIIALSLGQALARGAHNWLGHEIERARACLYIDYELDEEEQARRGLQLARGEFFDDHPEGVYYLCAAGRPAGEVFDAALAACDEHEIEVVFLDSVGLAMEDALS